MNLDLPCIFFSVIQFSQFRAVSDVPTEFVTKNISFHGIVKEVRSDTTLGICHIPLLRGVSKVLSSSDTGKMFNYINCLLQVQSKYCVSSQSSLSATFF